MPKTSTAQVLTHTVLGRSVVPELVRVVVIVVCESSEPIVKKEAKELQRYSAAAVQTSSHPPKCMKSCGYRKMRRDRSQKMKEELLKKVPESLSLERPRKGLKKEKRREGVLSKEKRFNPSPQKEKAASFQSNLFDKIPAFPNIIGKTSF